MSTRNGSPASANSASAVGFQADRVRRSRRITPAMSTGRAGRRRAGERIRRFIGAEAPRAAIDGTVATRSRSVNDEGGGRRGALDRRRHLRDAQRVIALGVQTWSTDVAAVERFWRVADELGYARITYGDGLWDFTHDGWTMLGALALDDPAGPHRSGGDLRVRCRRPSPLLARQAGGHRRSSLARPSRSPPGGGRGRCGNARRVGASRHPLSRRPRAGGGAGRCGRRARPSPARRDGGHQRTVRDAARRLPGAAPDPAAAPSTLDRGDAVAGPGADRASGGRLGSVLRDPRDLCRAERAPGCAAGDRETRAARDATLGRGGRDRRRRAGRARGVAPAIRRRTGTRRHRATGRRR